MTSWEYIKKRRGWTVRTVVAGLDDRSWDSFQAFFSQRGIECPKRLEYDQALKDTTPTPPVSVQQLPPVEKIKKPPGVTKAPKPLPKTNTGRNKKKIVKS